MLDRRLSRLPTPYSSAGGVLLWHLDLRPQPQDRSTALLSAQDRQRLSRLPPPHADRLLARRALLGALVTQHLQCRRQDVTLGPDARSVTARSGRTVHVSVSTSGERALVALAAEPVGIDLEVLAPVPEAVQIAASMFSEAETAFVRGGLEPGDRTESRDLRFLRTWVRKEAVVKLVGVGLTGVDLRSFTVDARLKVAAVVDDAGNPTGLLTSEVRLDGAVAALASGLGPSTSWPPAHAGRREPAAEAVPSWS